MTETSRRYIPTIGEPNWDISALSKPERCQIKSGLSISLLTTEEEYQKVIAYMYAKFPRHMDITNADNLAIQWHYSTAKRKTMVHNSVLGIDQDMYAFAIYDDNRDHEPIAFAGSYFQLIDVFADDDKNRRFECNASGKLRSEASDGPFNRQRAGFGYVMFIDPSYRRMGLATALWYAEAQLYREALGIRYQREIQNEDSLRVTQSMFSSPDKCHILSNGRQKSDGTRAQIRILLDYTDTDVVDGFKGVSDNLKTIYREPDWTFLQRETAIGGGPIEPFLKEIWRLGKLPK